MAAVLGANASRRAALALEWLPLGFGLLVLYAPSWYDLANGIWGDDEFAHGPVVLAIVCWLIWNERAALLEAPASPGRAATAGGLALLAFGLLLYLLGRSQDITLFEVASLAPVLAGIVLAMRGGRALRALWFPLVFIGFMVPLPGFVVDALSGPLKQAVSALAEEFLYAAGYPVARSGVILAVGRYQLLVADACSGLNSMFSLAALGLLYVQLLRRPSRLHSALVLAAVVPIAFAANTVRVLILVLVTYHYGDAAGQSFLHAGASLVLLATALSGVFLVDACLARASGQKPRA
jgi:exosortase B